MKAIITGSTGMIGKGLLLECLDDQRIEEVLVINRSPVKIQHPKLREIIHPDFFDLSTLKNDLLEYDICYFCLGISAAGMKKEDYTRITYSLTLSFARSLLDINPEIVFCYISGAGTDSSEQGRQMWARVKGRTENNLLKLPFKSVYMLRPGFIQPKKGIRSRTPLYNVIYVILWPFYPLLKGMKKYVTSTDRLGRAMIRLGSEGWRNQILEQIDLNELAS